MRNRIGLKQLQSLPLEAKVERSRRLIVEWYERWEGKVFVAFSGGKDSTVLLHLVRSIYPDVPGVFFNTGLEYPEILKFVRTKENITWIRPKKTFKQIVDKFGYPVISKEIADKVSKVRSPNISEKFRGKLLGERKEGTSYLPKKWRWLVDTDIKISGYCCRVMKRNPSVRYENRTGRKAFVGSTVDESRLRLMSYLKYGCNNYDAKRPSSQPLLIWTKEDIWEYVNVYNLLYSEIYDKGVERTGCMFCMFGVHMESYPNRFESLKRTHPKIYKFGMEYLGIKEVLDKLGIRY